MRSLKVLVAEDEPALRKIYMLVGEMYRAVVVEASNGKEAIKKLETEQFDMIITDFSMPYKNGFDVIRSATLTQSDAHILFVSAEEDKQYEGMLLGADYFLGKPFQVNDLKNVFEKVMLEKAHMPKV